jgi:NitT/TauT family transport system substrate-binding protein
MNAKPVKRALLTSVALAAMLLSTSAAFAADKVSIMIGGYEKHIYLPAKLAEGLGYFKAEGLEVELLNEGAGVDAENEMLAGAVQGVVGFYDHCVDLQTKGKYVMSVVQLSQSNWSQRSTPKSSPWPTSGARVWASPAWVPPPIS